MRSRTLPMPELHDGVGNGKLHALGDYSTSIRNFGTTDSYSTEPGELEHHTSKARYHRTDKKGFVKQITSIKRREAHIHRICDKQLPHDMMMDEEVATSPEARFDISKSQNYPKNIPPFLQRHMGDPAIKDFLPKLQHFLLAKIKEILTKENCALLINSSTAIMVSGTSLACSDSEVCVFIKADRMYRHNLMCLNYTTYDVHRVQDIINPSTSHCNVMLLAQASENSTDSEQHPYLYAQVRWYQHIDVGEGLSRCTPLDRVCFPPMAEPDTFGCCNVIPQFTQGLRCLDSRVHLTSLPEVSLTQQLSFVDRNMFMHYQWGLRVGHTYTHTSHKYADTTANFEDLEEEEVDFDQDQGISSSDVSDSDLGSDSDRLLVGRQNKGARLFRLLILGSGTDYQQQQCFIIMEHSAFCTRSQTGDVSGEGVKETSNLETSCHQSESFNTQYSFHSPSQVAGGNSGYMQTTIWVSVFGIRFHMSATASHFRVGHIYSPLTAGKDATIFDWFSRSQHIAETLEGTFLRCVAATVADAPMELISSTATHIAALTPG
ncbi:hypothetical protein BDR07DRAFT_1382959 [Suillus spraguei]|nr:hypothetical protein BDR07DRAFT_1382959 [Suillus spraguei]